MGTRRGKRYAIDSKRLLEDTDIFYLAYKGHIPTESLKVQLRDGRLTYDNYHALKEGGFNIEDYWLKDSCINTIEIDEALFYNLIDSVKKYKKLANRIEGFMNVRLYKPLKGYIEFCDKINISYLTLCNDEDYLEYLDDLEKKREAVNIVSTINIPEQEECPIEEKPKAYIKENVKTNVSSELKAIRQELDEIKKYQAILSSEWSEYGDAERSVMACLTNARSKTGELTEYRLEVLARNYDKLHHDLVKAIICKEVMKSNSTWYMGSIPNFLISMEGMYSLRKAEEYKRRKEYEESQRWTTNEQRTV